MPKKKKKKLPRYSEFQHMQSDPLSQTWKNHLHEHNNNTHAKISELDRKSVV